MNRRRATVAIVAVLIVGAAFVVAVYGALLYEVSASLVAITVAVLIAWAWRALGGRRFF